MNKPPLPSACPRRLSLSGGPALSTGLIAGQHAARAHSLSSTRTKSRTLLSITPHFCSIDLATGGLQHHCVHLPTHTDKHSFPISLQHKHTQPFPLSLALHNPAYTPPTPTSLVTSHLPDQGQLSRPVALDVEALTQHGHLCLSREINTRQGQRNRALRGSMLSQSVLSLLILSQITPHVCGLGTRKSCKLNMSRRQICEDSWGVLARQSRL